MKQTRLEAIRKWFDDYVEAYYDIDPEGLKNIILKVEHTRKVCEVMDLLTTGERLSPEDAGVAAATALLHDVGRFPQYRRWRTFRDSDSDNHARLAVEVIREQGVLKGLDAGEALLIEEAVRFHNLLQPPKQFHSPTDMFIRLVRDADKLDIWRVFLEESSLPPEEKASAVYLGLPDTKEFSSVCLAALIAKKVVQLKECRSVNDMKLMLISWSLELGFATSYRLLLERKYIPKIAATLNGGHDEVNPVLQEILAEVEQRAQSLKPAWDANEEEANNGN
jgi:hypothetical protein